MLAGLRVKDVKKTRRVENLTKSAIMVYFKPVAAQALHRRGEFQGWCDSPAHCQGQ